MAFAAVNSVAEPRSFSIGPIKLQIFTWSAISGDTSGTITCDRLSSASQVMLDGKMAHTAAPTFSANVVTLAFADPGANVFGTAIVFGK